jgi:hypothetical protein
VFFGWFAFEKYFFVGFIEENCMVNFLKSVLGFHINKTKICLF